MKKIRVLMPSEVPGFQAHVDEVSLHENLNDFVDSLIPRINIYDLGEWNILINVASRHTDLIGFYKRALRYPSDQEVEISTVIPIPNEEQASYGFDKPSKPPFYRPLNPDKFYTLPPNFDDYNNLYDYVLNSGKKIITLVFLKGFTCNGKKIRFAE
ncbi:MAG: Imm9 family immunity protein [Peptococcaceae bacterium]|nr:Imm9 family immunity protein [Peptococcaceae bacterium]